MDNKEYLDNLRHSAAHLLAAAVMELYPKAKRTIGPAIENGFYFDFDFGEEKVSDTDLPKIEAKMHEILPNWKGFERHELSAEDAKKEYPENEYKHELIDEFSGEGQVLSFYKSGEYWDLCRGGHVENPQEELKYFKLMNIAGAYWRGDEKNKMLTRIYGTAFPTQEDLDKYLEDLEEAKKRDHRKIGQDLDLFTFSDVVGKGLPLFTEKGATLLREISRFVVDEELKRGYKHVKTPNIAKTELYKTSGHYPYYKDDMYPAMKIDEDELILRPMTCPHHFELYKSKPRSYRELPIRYAELAYLYRYEKSGELTGLIRVREFTLADSHNFVRKIDAAKEINMVMDLIEYVSSVFGLKLGENFRYRLSLGDRENKEKYFDDPESWEEAESVLRSVLEERKAPYFEAKGEAAFYGPKIDVQMKNVNGKEDTAFTVQYDFCLPTRFKLTYTNEEGKEEQPVVIHRSSVGALERSLGFLIEYYAGNFPLWLSPVQVKILPVTDKVLEKAKEIEAKLRESNIRVELDSRSETLQAKIRDAQLEKACYMLILGEREVESGKLTVRLRSGENIKDISLDEFIEQTKRKIDERGLNL